MIKQYHLIDTQPYEAQGIIQTALYHHWQHGSALTTLRLQAEETERVTGRAPYTHVVRITDSRDGLFYRYALAQIEESQ